MARIRTIKPEFWVSEQITELSPMARLAFIGMWNFADDRGVHPASVKRLKAEVFPADDVTTSEVDGMVRELLGGGLLAEFSADGKSWWFVTGWTRHQKINRPTPKFPAPPAEFSEHSVSARGGLTERSPQDVDVEGKGCRREEEVEGNGREVSLRDTREAGASRRTPSDDIDAVVQHYRGYHPNCKPGKKERGKIAARLREGYTVDELHAAIDGCHVSPWHCGENPGGKLYQSLELIVRDSSHVNQFIESLTSGGPRLSEKNQRTLRAAKNWLERKSCESQPNQGGA